MKQPVQQLAPSRAMTVDEERLRKADNWLAQVTRFPPDSVTLELPKMAGSPRSCTLASLRCLSTLPVYGSTGHSAGDTIEGHHQQPASYRSANRVQPRHYAAYLERKVSSAVSNLDKLVRGWDGGGPQDAHLGELPSALRQADGGRPAIDCQPAPPQSTNAAGQRLSLAVAFRKRSASEASFDEPLPSVRQTCPPSSSMPRPSDDCSTPSGPADPASPAEGGWGGVSESVRSLPRCVVEAGPSGSSDTRASSGVALVQPCGPLPVPASEPGPASRLDLPAARNEQHPQQPAGTLAAPVVAIGAARSSARPGPRSGTGPFPGQVLPPQGSEGPHRHAFYSGAGGVSSCGSALAPAPSQRRPAPLVSNLGLQQGRPGPPRQALEAAGRAASVDSSARAQAHGGAELQQDGGALWRQPPCLCDLPAPSCTLQQLVSRRGLDGGGGPSGLVRAQAVTQDAAHRQSQQLPPLHPSSMAPPPPQHQQQRQGQQPIQTATAQAHESGSAANLCCGNLRLRTALEATAAATTAHWQQQVAALPAMAELHRRWPLSSLGTQLAGNAVEVNAGCRSSCGGGGSAAGPGAAGAGGPLLRHVQTPLPRRRAAAQLDLAAPQMSPGGPGGDGTLPLAALTESLPADSCQGRNELWDLFLLNLPLAAGPQEVNGPFDLTPPSCAPVVNDSRLPYTGMEGGRGGEGSSCGCCSDGDGGLVGEREAMEQHDDADAEGGQDDSDVYISSEGLVCLASLGSPHPSRDGWRLPFLVKQRLPPNGGEGPRDACPRTARGAAGDSCHGTAARREEKGSLARGLGRLPTLYFAEPLHNSSSLLSDSWSRLCANALSTCGSNGAVNHGPSSPPAAADGLCGSVHGALEVEEDCSCCQQDEWQLGGLSMLVLSHCVLGLMGSRSCSGPPTPLQMVALAGAPGLAGSAARQQGMQAVAAAVALRYSELACRAELFSIEATTLVMVVDPADGAVLAQQCLDRGALQKLATERSVQQSHCWQLAHDLLNELRRLKPGPYMLCMDAFSQSLELRGVGASHG